MSSQEYVSRKVQLTGGSTYTVSLPKEWAASNGIDSGDTVHLRPYHNGSIVLTAAEGNEESDPTRLGVDDRSRAALERDLAAAYRTGVERVELSLPADDDGHGRAVADAARDLPGFEVVPGDDGIAVRHVLRDDRLSPSQSLLRLQHLSLSMHRDAVDAVLGAGDPGRVDRRTSEFLREFNRLERHVRSAMTDLETLSHLDATRPELLDGFAVGQQLRRVTEQAVTVAAVATTQSEPPADGIEDEIADVARRTRDLVETAVDAAVGPGDSAAAHEVFDARSEIADTIAAFGASLDGAEADAYALGRVVTAIDGTGDCAAAIARRALDGDRRKRYSR